MNRVISVLLLFTLFQLSLKAQVSLKIVIENLENNSGCVIMDFRDGDDKALKGIFENISDNQCVITLDSLQPGKYSFKYFHDENNNNEMDTNWIGIPKEGMGFSNNAKGKFGPPDFEDTVFEVKKDTTIVCTAYYIKF